MAFEKADAGANARSEDDTEIEMRRALGLDRSPPTREFRPHTQSSYGQDRPRHRFVQDGDVPVVVIRGGRDHADTQRNGAAPSVNRLEIAETALRAERDARESAERRLADAEITIRDLRTRLGHAVLACNEATARNATLEREAADAALSAAAAVQQIPAATAKPGRKARVALEEIAPLTLFDTPPAEPEPAELESAKTAPVEPHPAPKVSRKPRTAKPQKLPQVEASEPEPIKWWLTPVQKPARRKSKA